MTKRERIINEVKTTLETILTANGYATDAGQNIFIDRSVFDESETKPFININEGDDQLVEKIAYLPGIKMKLSLPLSIEGFNSCSPLTPSSKGHELIGDIKKCLLSKVWSSDVREIQYQSSTIAQHESGSGLVTVSVNADIIYIETIGKPEE
ncbi:MAG: hypothetical protein GY694_17170 [Gammaproteobacteria bacterium]|nr:hypothetical protein [Gammaproteobacteria bacterium]